MKVRLTRKLAEQLDGIDVSALNEGDVFDLPRAQAQLLIAEHWAMPIDTVRSGAGLARAGDCANEELQRPVSAAGATSTSARTD
jgi:hypothetical protein